MSLRRQWHQFKLGVSDSFSSLRSALDGWSTVITMLSAVAVAVFTYYLVEAGDRQHLATLKSLRLTANALKQARVSNDLVAKSNEIARRGNEASSRAWVVHGRDFTPICLAAGKPIEVAYTLVNTGNRPATEVFKHSMIRVLSAAGDNYRFNPPDKVPYPSFGKRVPSLSVAGPGQRINDTLIAKPGPSRDLVEGILAERDTVYLWGKVTYQDGYGVDRLSTWCFRWKPKSRCEGTFITCDQYNYAD